MIKLPLRILRRVRVRCGSLGGSSLVGALGECFLLGLDRLFAEVVRADRRLRLVASHDVAKREKQPRKQNDSEEKPDDVPAFEHAFSRAAFSPIAHSYLRTSSKALFTRLSQRLNPLVNDIDGERKHNRCVLLDTYLCQCL